MIPIGITRHEKPVMTYVITGFLCLLFIGVNSSYAYRH